MRDLAEVYQQHTEWLQEGFEDFAGEVDEFGLEPNTHRISAQSYDGFIAHTNGGLKVQVMRTLSHSYHEAGQAEANIIEPYYDNAVRDAAMQFIDERDELRDAWNEQELDPSEFLYKRWNDAEEDHQPTLPLFPDVEPVQFWQTELGGERETFYEFESEYMVEGGAYFIDLTAIFYAADHRRNITGHDELYIFAGVNTDFEYGRERGLETTFERTYPVSRLTQSRLTTVLAAAAESL